MPIIYHEGYSLGDGTGDNQLLKDTVGWTGKNLIINGGARTMVVNGVTFVVNDDGSVTVNGTATGANANFVMLSRSSNSVILNAGQYTLTGCPTGGGSGTYQLIAQATRDGTLHAYGEDWGSGKTFSAEDGDSLQIVINITGGQTVSNLTFYPMLRRADILDDTYEPYHENVEEEIEQIYADNGVLGAKNLLQNTATSQTINGVTFTVNADGSVTANGTATANIVSYFIDRVFSLKAGKYLISGTPNSIFSVGNTGVRISNEDFSINIFGDEYGTLFTLNNDTSNLKVEIRIASGTTVSNITFKPMLRLASDPDDTYQPYAMTNRELTEEKINIADLKTVVSASSDFADFKTRIASL